MPAFVPAGVELIAKNARAFFADMGKADSTIVGFGKSALGVAAKATAALTGFGVAVGAVSLKAAIDWESAFAGVRKTVDATEEELKETEQALLDLSTTIPVAPEQLAAIAELGGQLGIVDSTTEDVSGTLTEFTATMAAVAVATDLTTEEAAIGFARMATVMGTSTDEIDNMAAALVDLGNNSAATERDIFNFAERIAGAGALAGLTEADVLAIGAAMSSVGIQAEAGGTAVQKVLLAMNQAVVTGSEEMEIFAAVAGIAADDFGAAWEVDAGQVFQQFVEGLGTAGDDAISILQALGLEDQRLIRAFLSLAGAGDLLNESMDRSTEAFEDNVALTNEAEKRYETTASQLTILKNTLQTVAITIGSILLPAFNRIVQIGTKFIKFISFAVKSGDTLNDFLADIPEGLRPFAKGLAEIALFFKDRIIPAIKNFLKIGASFVKFIAFAVSGGDFLNDFLADIPDNLKPFAVGFAKAADSIIKFVKDAIGFIIKNKDAIVGALIAIGTALTVAFAAKKIMGIVKLLTMLTNPIGIAIAVIGLLGAAWAKNLGGIQEKTAAVIGFIAPIFKRIVDAVSLLFKQFKAFGLKRFFSTFEDGSTIIGGFLKRLGVGEKVAEKIGRAINALAQFLMKAIPEAIRLAGEAWTNILQPALQAVGQFITETLIPTLIQVFQWLSQNIPIALQILSDLWTGTLQPALAQVWAFIQTNLMPVFRGLLSFFFVFIPVIKKVAGFLIEKFGAVVSWVQENWPMIQMVVESVLSFVSGIVQAALSAILSFWEAHGGEIIATATTVWETVKTLIDTISGTVQGIIAAVMLLISGDWEAAWQAISDAALLIWEGIKTFIDGMMAVIKLLISLGLDAIKALWVLIWSKVKEIAETIWGKIKTAISDIMDKIKEAIETGVEKAREFVETGFEAVLTFLTGIVDRFRNAGKEIVDAIRRGIEDAWQGLVDWFKGKLKGLLDLLPSWSPPRDPRSPLHRLERSGVGFVGEIMKGIAQQMPALQAQLTTGLMPQVIASPAGAAAGGGVTNQVNVDMGGVTIANEMDQFVFEERVRTVVRDAVGET